MGPLADRYRLLRVLGRGGHGEVWEAEDRLTSTLVAVKLLRSSGVEPARVRREVSALRLLRIPGVVQMLDEGVDGDTAFVVMERVQGDPFPGHERRAWADLAPAATSLLETLSRVHQIGVVHRDLKPQNVLVDPQGRATILDFGLSLGASLGQALSEEGSVAGTPDYLSPEQLLGTQVTPATDLYSLGVMLFEALSGRLPHEAGDLQALLRSRLAVSHLPSPTSPPTLPLTSRPRSTRSSPAPRRIAPSLPRSSSRASRALSPAASPRQPFCPATRALSIASSTGSNLHRMRASMIPPGCPSPR
ncbi:MAG: serine/threonine-protein kinase [Polyangiaceae bacterium]